jgi:hypothetical protein
MSLERVRGLTRGTFPTRSGSHQFQEPARRMDSSPMATVEPETMTDRPACRIVSTTAVSTSSPWASSSRKITSSE